MRSVEAVCSLLKRTCDSIFCIFFPCNLTYTMMNRLMKGSRVLTFVLALALMFSLTACDDNGGGMDDDDPDPDPELLSDILSERDDLSILFDAVDASGQLNLTQNPEADITVFAPNNSAFADINLNAALADENSELLEQVVQYHVLTQSVLSSGLSESTVETAAGDDIRITTDADGNFLVNGNSITAADLEADNGVLHVIDGLLLENRALAERLVLTTPTTQLAQLAQNAGAAESLGELNNATLFAPRNIQDAIAESGLDLGDDELPEVLQYHVIVNEENGPIDSDQLTSLLDDGDGEITISTEQGEDLTIAQDGDEIVFNNGDATLDRSVLDKFTDNFSNVFHVIDGVLLPPSLQPTEATPIADARTLEDNAEVTIEGTLTRAKGRYLFIQDDTAGLLLFDFDGFNDQLDAGDLAIGDEIRISGRMDTFNEQRQIRIDDDAFGIEVLSSDNNLPDVPTITLNELNTNPEDYIHQLVRVENFTINPDGDTEFQAGGGAGNYDIDDGTATSVLRLEGNDSSEYEGQPIPEGEVIFEGAVTQFQGTYQLHLALESDLIVE